MKVKEFWKLHNRSVWRVKRYEMRDMYWFMDTDRYLYKSSIDELWRGRKKNIENRASDITFSTEEQAFKWWTKDNKNG